jgi:four helix bundle protein
MSNKTQEVKQRTKKFALQTLNLIELLPNTVRRRVLANQLARSATSVPENVIMPLLREADEFTAIFTSGRRSAKGPTDA